MDCSACHPSTARAATQTSVNPLAVPFPIYYLPSGANVEVAAAAVGVPVAERFDAARVEGAVRQSQAGAITYKRFCEIVMAAGCAGYLVSLRGRRVVYFGRTAERHVEHFPPVP